MAKRLDVDGAKLLDMIKSGVDNKQIMAEFGFKTVTQLKNAYANAAMEAQLIPPLATGRKSAGKKESNPVLSVNKRGSLTIPKDMVAALGFQEGDNFKVRKSRAGVSLKKLEN